MTALAPMLDSRRPTRHLPELPLPTAEDVAADWGLGFHLTQALRQMQAGMIKSAWGVLMTARCKLGPQETAGAERPPAEVVSGRADAEWASEAPKKRQRRQINADHVCDGWGLPRELRSVVGHIERVSKAKTALGAVEALDDALASLGNAIEWASRAEGAPAPSAWPTSGRGAATADGSRLRAQSRSTGDGLAPAPCAHECDRTTGADAPPRPERAPASVRSKS